MKRRTVSGLFHRCEVLVAAASIGLVACTASTPAASTAPGTAASAQSSSSPLSLSDQAGVFAMSAWLRYIAGIAPTQPCPVPQLDLLNPPLSFHYSASVKADSKAMDGNAVATAIVQQGSSPTLDGTWTESTDAYDAQPTTGFGLTWANSFTVPPVSVKGSFEVRHIAATVTASQPLPTDQDNGIVWRGNVNVQFTWQSSAQYAPPSGIPSPSPGFFGGTDGANFAVNTTGGHMTSVSDNGQPAAAPWSAGCPPGFVDTLPSFPYVVYLWQDALKQPCQAANPGNSC
jgi:hypothetical protein